VAAPLAALVLSAALLALAGAAEQAWAVILPAVTLDGPSEEIVGFGGAAMAEDGTGGVVYLKRVGGVTHVFVSRYVDGRFLAPVRVDTEEQYAASWPRIGAADGGELVVVWATAFASSSKGRTLDELLGATLGPGGSSFGRAVIVDPDIGEGVGASPDLAMSSTGQADVVYRVVEENENVPLLRPSDVVEQVRLAHYDGMRWSNLGAVNRDLGVSMRAPTAANAPQVALGPTGNGIVVWQEPEIEGVARIWARRIFGSTLDYVMPVSAATYGGAPIITDADSPSLAFSLLGQAEVAYRQLAAPGSPLPGPRIFLNTLPDGEAVSGIEFQGAIVADGDVPGGQSASVGRPCLDVDENRFLRLVYDDNGEPRVVEGTDKGALSAASLGPAFVGSSVTPANELSCASAMDPEGGGVSAWPSAASEGTPAVAVREDFPDGAVQTGLVSGGAGGLIDELAVGRSGLGDGLVAFEQGPPGDAAIVATEVSAPPLQFQVTAPKGWVRPSEANIQWEDAASANGPLRYTVLLDGRRLPTPAGATALHLTARGLSSGRHEVQVLATDLFGRSALTAPTPLKVDGVPPSVSIATANGGRTVTVRVSDRYSGVDRSAVTVSFGDGRSGHGRVRFRHTYTHAGAYRVVVHVRDRLGVSGAISRVVSAP
jgi:PKD domain